VRENLNKERNLRGVHSKGAHEKGTNFSDRTRKLMNIRWQRENGQRGKRKRTGTSEKRTGPTGGCDTFGVKAVNL